MLARHEPTRRLVAIKYLNPMLLHDRRALARFRDEAALLSRVSSPHVVRLYDYIEAQDGAALIMEAVPGRSLRSVLDEHAGPLPPEAALSILKGSLLGLAAAHAVGVVHRDYKPGNVLVGDDGESKLIDFGVAALTGRADTVGTAGYMAPEQWRGEPASPATDIYAATCVFVECIAGMRPFDGRTVAKLRTQHLTDPVPLHLVPAPLRPIVARGMAKEPERRLWDAQEFVTLLESVAAQAYGSDWEHRGIIALGSVAAGVAMAAPLATFLLSQATAPGAIAMGQVVAGQTPAAHAAVNAGTASGKGLLAKVGGGKGVAALGTAGVAAVTAYVLLLPSEPTVGGQAQGTFGVHFTRPGVLTGQPYMPAADTPYVRLHITVRPARVKAGTRIRVTTRFEARTPQGGKYLPGGELQCFGAESNRRDVIRSYGFWVGGNDAAQQHPDKGTLGFYAKPPARTGEMPQNSPIALVADRRVTDEKQPYVPSLCAYMSSWTDVRELTIPSPKTLPAGDYLLSVAVPPRITSLRSQGDPIDPAAAGAVVTGSLPEVTVLAD